MAAVAHGEQLFSKGAGVDSRTGMSRLQPDRGGGENGHANENPNDKQCTNTNMGTCSDLG